MSSAPAILRSLIVYAVCVPLAITVGYLVTNPMDYSTLGVFGIVALVLAFPLLIRWHYPLLVLSLQMTCMVFFVKGSPNLWLVMMALSLGISLLERALSSQMHFIRVPQITWPLICLVGVVLVTAKFTGGFGMKLLGSDVYGGRKYLFIIAGVLLYFALTARRIPAERAGLYITLFFLGAVPNFIGDLYPLAPAWSHFVFWIFPPNAISGPYALGQTRLGGFATTGVALGCILMARYGIRGIFLSGKLWRVAVFIFSVSLTFLGGYRAAILTLGLIFVVQFFLEGLHRTKLLLAFACVGTMAAVALVPLAPKLPFTVQRTLAFLPLHIDTEARQSAQDTLDWRWQMWTALWPQVPRHLLLGKGLAISTEEFNEMMGTTATMAGAAEHFDPSQGALALSYDYHNGTLSVLIPFGLWGGIAFLWFLIAGLRVMYGNFRYGDPALLTINTFLFADFFVTFLFFFFTGSLNGDMMRFAGFLGLSVALNGGVCQPAPQPVPARETLLHPRGVLPRSQPRPAFPR